MKKIIFIIGIYVCLVAKFCYSLNIESTVNYNITRNLICEKTFASPSLVESKNVKQVIKKIARQSKKSESTTPIESHPKYLHNKKAVNVPLSIKPDADNIHAGKINYETLINGAQNSEYKFKISESSSVGIK